MAADAAGTPRPGPFPWQQPLGARPLDGTRTQFRVWAPAAAEQDGVGLIIGDADPVAMDPVGYGVYELTAEAPAGTDYRFVIDGEPLPDPSSRWQPEGLRGPSRVLGTVGDRPDRPGEPFRAAPMAEQVIYELHIGTFSSAGTFDGAVEYLGGLAELGITAVEVMPIAEFPGTRGWGYDGVYLSAAQSSYGGPDGFRRFVDAAHAAGLAVILDVVYNHLGAGSDAIDRFGPYFTGKYSTPWGSAINYDDAQSDAVREWVCQSAEGWFADFGIDGLRLDAVHAIFDDGPEHLVAELTRRVRAVNPDAIIVAESPLNDPKVMRAPSQGGWGCDAAWADDFHHCVRTLLTDEHEGYYADFGKVADLAKALRRPFVYDGGYSAVHEKRVGAPADDLAPSAFVVASQNHDQVGNRAFGDRMPEGARPLAALLTLLSGFTPMLFMGEEYSEPAPFQYFVDHIDPEIAEATRQGRREEFAAFASFGHDIPDPMAVETFTASKLTRNGDPAIAELYRRLLVLRRRLPAEDPSEIGFDETERWLAWTRGPVHVVVNLSDETRRRPAGDRVLELGTHDAVKLAGDSVVLPPLSGAVLIDPS